MDVDSAYPPAVDATRVGTYCALTCAGGGYVWDAVLEYRVWCHPERGAPAVDGGSDYFYAFATYEKALMFSLTNEGTEPPLALVLQEEYIDEPEPGHYIHRRQRRLTEWCVPFLRRPRRTPRTIPDFLASKANRSESDTGPPEER